MQSHTSDKNAPVTTLSVYAGKQVDFGEGDHLFIRPCASIREMLHTYFHESPQRNVFLDVRDAQQSVCEDLCLKNVHDIREMLYMAPVPGLEGSYLKHTLDDLAKKLVYKRDLRTCTESVSRNVADADWLGRKRAWEKDGHVCAEWIAHACTDAALVYHIYMRLQTILKETRVPSGENFNTLQAYERFFMPSARRLIMLERNGVQVDEKYVEDIHTSLRVDMEKDEEKFLQWAEKYVEGDVSLLKMTAVQLQQLFFAPYANIHSGKTSRTERIVKGKGKASTQTLKIFGAGIKAMVHTNNGVPSTSIRALTKAAEACTDKEKCAGLHAYLRMKGGKTHAKQTERHMRKCMKNGRMHARHYIDGNTNYVSGGDMSGVDMTKVFEAADGEDIIFVSYPHARLFAMARLSGCDVLKARVESSDAVGQLCSLLSDDIRHALGQASLELGDVQTFFPSVYKLADLLDKCVRNGGDKRFLQRCEKVTHAQAGQILERWFMLHPTYRKWHENVVRSITSTGKCVSGMGRVRDVRKGDVCEGVRFVIGAETGENVLRDLRKVDNERLIGIGWKVVWAGEGLVLSGPAYARDVAERLVRLHVSGVVRGREDDVDGAQFV